MANLSYESHSPLSLSLQRSLLGGRYTDLKRLGGTSSVVFSAVDALSKHRLVDPFLFVIFAPIIQFWSYPVVLSVRGSLQL